jgi:hypothetical protein
MVQLYSTFFVLASLIVAGISAPNAKRSVDEIKRDLGVISSQITDLNVAISAFSASGTLAHASVCIIFAAALLASFQGLVLTDPIVSL